MASITTAHGGIASMFKNFKIDNARRVEFEGDFIQIPKSKWGYLRDIEFFGKSTQDGEPSPDNPVDIINTPPELDLTVCGKNLASETKLLADNTFILEVTFDNKECFSWNAGSENGALRILENSFGFGSYTLSGNFYVYSTDGGSTRLRFLYTDGSFDDGPYFQANQWQSFSFVSDSSKKIAYIRGVNNNNLRQVYLEKNTLQVEQGDTATDYEEFNGGIYPYRLEDVNGVLHEAGDLPDGKSDRVFEQNGRLYLEKKIGIRILDGSEAGITVSTPKTDTTQFTLYVESWGATGGSYSMLSNILCSHFETVTASYVDDGDSEGIALWDTNTRIKFRILNSTATTVADLRAWLAAQYNAGTPMTIQYQLATPQIIPLKKYDPISFPYNQKPVQPEDDVANVFTDVNIPMKFKAISY
jgi:hypothetical protein